MRFSAEPPTNPQSDEWHKGWELAPLSTCWPLFDPTQIKSATANNGDFDPQNPSILKSQVQADRNDDTTETPEKRTARKAINTAAKSAATKINKLLPGMGEIIVVHNVGTLQKVAGFERMGLSEEDLDDIRDGKIQGFYSAPLNKTVILTDNIKVMEGEGLKTAAARVILHESAHKGAAILRREPGMQKRWEGLTKEIRNAFGHEMDAIAGERGYAHDHQPGEDQGRADAHSTDVPSGHLHRRQAGLA